MAGDDVECRASTGDCDPAETCNGEDPDCPADAMAEEGTECRASAGPCDTAETCDGESAACPDDTGTTEGTPCDDDDPCSMVDVCDAEGGCSGTEACDDSPVTGTGDDTRIGICLTDSSCDAATGGPGCSSSHRVFLKSSFTDWEEDETFPMAQCGTYWAYTSPPLESGVEALRWPAFSKGGDELLPHDRVRELIGDRVREAIPNLQIDPLLLRGDHEQHAIIVASPTQLPVVRHAEREVCDAHLAHISPREQRELVPGLLLVRAQLRLECLDLPPREHSSVVVYASLELRHLAELNQALSAPAENRGVRY